MVQAAPGLELDVERGPDWLFVRPHGLPQDDDGPPLGEMVWGLLEQNFVHRLVLELDALKKLDDGLIHELLWLEKRIYAVGGMMRICGLKPVCVKALCKLRLDRRFHPHTSREDAVMSRHAIAAK